MSEPRFEDALLQLFLRAEAEGRRGTAERLMQALEAFYADSGTGADPSTARNGCGAAAERRPLGAAMEPRQNGAPERDEG